MSGLSTAYQVVPLRPVNSQTLQIALGGQVCGIKVYTKEIEVPEKPPGMIVTDPEPVYETIDPIFLDLYLAGTLILGGAQCLCGNRIVIDKYLGFVGDLAVIDTQSNAVYPTVAGLGTRFLLTYWPNL